MTFVIESIQVRIEALVEGFLIWPDTDMWYISILVLCLYGLLARWVGLRSGLIKKEKSPLTTWHNFLLGIRLLVHPALVEETIFRGLLLPSPSGSSITPSVLFWFSMSLLLFVLAHPINSLLLRRSARPLFTDPVFLTLSGFLGLCTSALYWHTASLWPAILFHWFVVFIWMTRFGGFSTLTGRT
jgi:predicted Abi (CAAX) family protease